MHLDPSCAFKERNKIENSLSVFFSKIYQGNYGHPNAFSWNPGWELLNYTENRTRILEMLPIKKRAVRGKPAGMKI